jgi:hypothetical protein
MQPSPARIKLMKEQTELTRHAEELMTEHPGMTLGEAMAEAIRQSMLASKLRKSQHAVRAMKLLRQDREYQQQKEPQQPQEPARVRAEMLAKYPKLRTLIIRRAELRMREHTELTYEEAVVQAVGEVVVLMSSLRTIARLRTLRHVSVAYTHPD